MIDLFVKVWADTNIRLGMAMAVVARCLLFDARVHVIMAQDSLHLAEWPEKCASFSVLPREQFWISSKAFAEEHAKSDPYVLLDDDHLPIGTDWLTKGVAAIKAHEDYAWLSSWSINGEVPEKRPPRPQGSDNWTWGEECTGTPYFCRKGSIDPKKMPLGPLMSYDTVLSSHVRRQGKGIGFLREVRHNHLGYGFSQVIPGWWKA